MWRTTKQREESAVARLELARRLWDWKPHAAQSLFFCSGAQVRIAACGRRWGKTEALSLDAATLALAERGSRQLIVAPTDAQARLLGNEVAMRLMSAFEKDEPEVAGRKLILRQRPGLQMTIVEREGASEGESWVICRTAGRDGRNLRGLWAHRIIVDEAARVPDCVLTDVLLPMLTDKGGEYVLASSPYGRRSAYYRLYARGMAAGLPNPQPLPSRKGSNTDAVTYESFQCPTRDNQFLNAAFLEAQREELGETVYAQEFEAQFVDDFGAVFREVDIDAAIAALPGVRLEDGGVWSEPQSGRRYAIGIDWGRKQDFTVVAVLDTTERPARLIYLARWQGTGWEAQAADAAAIVAQFSPWRVLADGNSIGDPLAEQLQHEIRAAILPGARCPQVERFTFGADSKQALVDRLTLGLSARAIQYPPHQALLRELRGFEYGDTGSSGRAKMGARSGGHDDCVIALALAWFAAPQFAPLPPSARILLGSQIGSGR